MENILLYSDDSSDSVKEMEPPEKLPPPLIDLTKDDSLSNVKQESKNASTSNDKKLLRKKEKSKDDHPSHWTSDMVKYYNYGQGRRYFSVEKLQAKMDKDPSLWDVAPRDLLYMQNRRIRSHVKCWNCCQFGHTVYQCREEIHLPKCHMCGEVGHLENACPRAVCLTCGNQMALYVFSCYKCASEANTLCSRCYLFGHNFINCSDNWRRFHSTIGKTTIDVPTSYIYKSQRDLWCCNCGRKGHNQINCAISRDLTYPDTFPFVASYDTKFQRDIYNDFKEEPVASTSALQTRKRGNPHTLANKNNESKLMRNLSKLDKKKKRKRRKKNKRNTAIFEAHDVILCE